MPQQPAIYIFDEWQISDSLQQSAFFSRTVKPLFYFMYAIIIFLAPFSIFVSPIAMMKESKTTKLIMSPNWKKERNISFTDNSTASSYEPPWGEDVDSICASLHLMYFVAFFVVLPYLGTTWNLGMTRLMLRNEESRFQILVAMTTSFVYTVSLASLLPTTSTLVYLIARILVVCKYYFFIFSSLCSLCICS